MSIAPRAAVDLNNRVDPWNRSRVAKYFASTPRKILRLATPTQRFILRRASVFRFLSCPRSAQRWTPTSVWETLVASSKRKAQRVLRTQYKIPIVWMGILYCVDRTDETWNRLSNWIFEASEAILGLKSVEAA